MRSKSKNKKLTAVLLSVLLVLSLIPATIYAESPSQEKIQEAAYENDGAEEPENGQEAVRENLQEDEEPEGQETAQEAPREDVESEERETAQGASQQVEDPGDQETVQEAPQEDVESEESETAQESGSAAGSEDVDEEKNMVEEEEPAEDGNDSDHPVIPEVPALSQPVETDAVNNDGNTSIEDAVAMIDSTPYDSLEAAAQAAAAGDTIVMIADETDSTGEVLIAANDVTLDLAGHTFTGSNQGYVMKVTGGLTITDTSDGGGSIVSQYDGIFVTNDSTLTVEGGTITANESVAIFADGSGKIFVTGGKVYGSETGIKAVGSSSRITVSGGEAAGRVAIDAGGFVIVSDEGRVTGTEIGIKATHRVLNITGGEITGATGVQFFQSNTIGSDYNKVYISGGKITGYETGLNIDVRNMTISGGEISGGTTGLVLRGSYQSYIHDGTITSDGTGIAISNSGTMLTLHGGTITGAGVGILQGGTGVSRLTLDGGIVTGGIGIDFASGHLDTNTSTRTIVNGINVALNIGSAPSISSSEYIRGGTYISENGEAIKSAQQKIVSGGWYSNPVPYSYVSSGMHALTTPGVIDDNGTAAPEGKENLYTVANGSLTYVAEINGTPFETLPSAFEAADDGETVSLLADITLNHPCVFNYPDKSVTLYVGYRNISVSSNFAGNTVIDVQAGTLTIDGYTESRELYGINGGGRNAALSVHSGAALEVRSVKIANARYGIIAEQDSTVLVNAQSLGSSDSSYTITEVTTSILSIGAKVTIDGVSTLRNSGGKIQSPAIELSGGDTLTVKGGTIDGFHAIHQDANAFERSTIIIEGGTVQDSSGSYAAAIYTEGTADIQIRGGTLKVPQTQLGNAVEGLGNTNLVMSGGSIVRGSNRDGYGIHITGIGDVIISGGTIDMPNGGLSIREGTFSITGGTIKGSNAVLIGYYVDTHLTPGVVTGSITGGDLQGGSYGVRGTYNSPDDADGTNIVIDGSALIKGGISALYTNMTGYITMEGGYVGDNSSNTAACVPEGKVLVASKLNEGYYEVDYPAAKIERTGELFGNLQDAVDAAAEGDTLTIVRTAVNVFDTINIGKEITINLNGNNIFRFGGTTVHLFDITDGAAFTLVDESEESTGSVSTSGSSVFDLRGGSLCIKGGKIVGVTNVVNVIEDGGTVTVEGGSLAAVSGGEYDSVISVSDNAADGHIVISGGTVKGNTSALISMVNPPEGAARSIEVSGDAILESTESAQTTVGIRLSGFQLSSSAAAVTVSGGEINTVGAAISTQGTNYGSLDITVSDGNLTSKADSAILLDVTESSSSGRDHNTTLTVSGGILSGQKYGIESNASDNSSVTITDGVIKGETASVANTDTGAFNINGGCFSDDAGNGSEFSRPDNQMLAMIEEGDYQGYYALTDADPAVVIIKSANVEFQGQIQLQFTLDFPENVLADEGAYVTFEKAGTTTKKRVSEGTAREEGVTFTIPVPAPEYADDIVVRVYGGDDSRLTLKSVGGTDYTEEGFAYSVKTYAQNKSQSGSTEEMRNLAKALDDYGMTSQIYFGYGDYIDLTVDGAVTAVTLDDLAPYALTTSGTRPAGVTGASIMVAFDTDNTLRITFKTDGSRQMTDYSFQLDGTETAPTKSGKNAILQVKNIAAPNLDTPHTFTVTDGADTYTVTASALSYAYTSVKNGSEERQNLGKALYLYNKAADAQFDN